MLQNLGPKNNDFTGLDKKKRAWTGLDGPGRGLDGAWTLFPEGSSGPRRNIFYVFSGDGPIYMEDA